MIESFENILSIIGDVIDFCYSVVGRVEVNGKREVEGWMQLMFVLSMKL